jgi:hypothetical protein
MQLATDHVVHSAKMPKFSAPKTKPVLTPTHVEAEAQEPRVAGGGFTMPKSHAELERRAAELRDRTFSAAEMSEVYGTYNRLNSELSNNGEQKTPFARYLELRRLSAEGSITPEQTKEFKSLKSANPAFAHDAIQ